MRESLGRPRPSGGDAGLQHLDRAIQAFTPYAAGGRVVGAVGTLIRGVGVNASIGQVCLVHRPGLDPLMTEVVGFAGGEALLAPMGGMQGVAPDMYIEATGAVHQVGVGPHLLGRAVDALGMHFVDAQGGRLASEETRPVVGPPPLALSRKPIRKPLETGVRAIDGLLACGEGQRIGIFAPAGCGKSTLLGMLASHSSADINVLALIGERGREVSEFIEHSLGPESMRRSVVVVATSDCSAMERVRAAQVATSIAEYFRDQGKAVLLMIDSVTRYARALREIGLSAGEPPARRGFPPSVFASLPALFERAGQSNSGSITAFYTVLEETDDGMDPVSEEVRSLLDGHIVLSRKLAESGHFPAIDVLASASRVMPQVVTPEHIQSALRVRELWSVYRDLEILIQVGEYKRGEDPRADTAVERHPFIRDFLRQRTSQTASFDATLAHLQELAA
ncbi:type III secretion system ATPase, FliI/YscN [Noviherbaspirillum humi]|uniref:Type III secretion system ATPase, FliI/YscN n=1 Tax=Noviherbaspirillum humi TaxID=1688639 RepID=A0A239JX75_9BURK|nr:FliI/YscN family ATPase [Noviherbaspirillum humi]SNT10491.1 type III secretion system ATPase, FliI/YscN [Noviherbaspirillum humi]